MDKVSDEHKRVIRKLAECRAELAALRAAQGERDRDWILAIATALGTDSGLKVPIIPAVEPFRELFAALRAAPVSEERELAEYKRIRDLLIKALMRAIGRSREAIEEGPLTCAVEHAKEVERLLRAPQQQGEPVAWRYLAWQADASTGLAERYDYFDKGRPSANAELLYAAPPPDQPCPHVRTSGTTSWCELARRDDQPRPPFDPNQGFGPI